MQAVRPSIQTPFLLCKMLVGIVPNPLCTASAGCRLRICAKCFYNEKEHRGLPKNGKNPRCSLFIGSALYPWGPFLLRKTSLHSSELSSVPASRSVPCGSPGILFVFFGKLFRYTPNTVFVSRMPVAVFMVCSIKDRIACWLYPLSDALTI